MRRFTMTAILIIASATGCKGSKSPAEQCDAIYQKGMGQSPYTTDKAKFIEACSKTGDETRRCLQLTVKEKLKDQGCGPMAEGKAFDESMEIMKLGQGTP
ncbi:MAG: hypothetical protein JWO36_3348 [Myxococcales bacterium]|nr:hypothetical protein [Myxococcales bacterium]